MKKLNANRRSFMQFSAAAFIAAPTLLSLNVGVAQAGEKLSEDDPMAKALGYKEDTNTVDASAYATHSADQVCVDCALYQGDDPEWGACGAVGGKLVAGQGWCVAYAPKA